MANMHIPAVKQLGHTRNASPMQLNTNPVSIRLEKVYLQRNKFYISNDKPKVNSKSNLFERFYQYIFKYTII